MSDNYKYTALKAVIDRGMQLMQGNNVSENLFRLWLRYSQSILEQIAQGTTFHINYLQVILGTMNTNIEPSQKLSMCLKYLIGILPLIK